MRRELIKFKKFIVVFFVIVIYIIFSWWSWWYGGSFSCRPMIDFYCILALPLAALINVISNSKKAIKYIFVVIFLSWIGEFELVNSFLLSVCADNISGKIIIVSKKCFIVVFRYLTKRLN